MLYFLILIGFQRIKLLNERIKANERKARLKTLLSVSFNICKEINVNMSVRFDCKFA